MKRLACFILSVLIIAGCAQKSTEGSTSTPSSATASSSGATQGTGIVGKWKVDPALVNTPQPDQPQGFMIGFSSTFWYDFAADNTFKGSMTEGKYTLNGSKLEMTTTKLNGQDIEKLGGSTAKPQMTGELSSDGKSLVLYPPANGMLPKSLSNGIKMVRE